ncbi:MAG: hypothetical protein IPJ23_01770 [Ignavibacteriales bacterium]|nr:hypothetical protein [Ignavibacteriales bacterium]
MKKLFVLLLVLQSTVMFSQEIVIKSLKTFTSKDVNAVPVLSSPLDLLIIDFDVQIRFSTKHSYYF